MARWYSDDPEFSEITRDEKAIRDKIVSIITKYTTEMEGYSYLGSNPCVREGDYENIADDILREFNIKE